MPLRRYAILLRLISYLPPNSNGFIPYPVFVSLYMMLFMKENDIGRSLPHNGLYRDCNDGMGTASMST